jgi:hypothetical protein
VTLFLSQNDVYRLLQREQPEDVYADGPPSAFYSTADNGAVAGVIADAYGNAQSIAGNYFPQTADDRLADWEITAFGYNLDASLSTAQRQSQVTEQIRTRKGIRKSDMLGIVLGILGSSVQVKIVGWGDKSGAWVLGESPLGISTFLGGSIPRNSVYGANVWQLGWAHFGITQDQWSQLQADAYTYEVRIYGYTLTTKQRQQIDQALSLFEAARDRHIITDGLDPNIEQ